MPRATQGLYRCGACGYGIGSIATTHKSQIQIHESKDISGLGVYYEVAIWIMKLHAKRDVAPSPCSK